MRHQMPCVSWPGYGRMSHRYPGQGLEGAQAGWEHGTKIFQIDHHLTCLGVIAPDRARGLCDHLARTVEDPESEQQCQDRVLNHTRSPSGIRKMEWCIPPPRMNRVGHRRLPEVDSASGVSGHCHPLSHLVSTAIEHTNSMPGVGLSGGMPCWVWIAL
jgi:hypothetical protein